MFGNIRVQTCSNVWDMYTQSAGQPLAHTNETGVILAQSIISTENPYEHHD
jgi:hypothetical protein